MRSALTSGTTRHERARLLTEIIGEGGDEHRDICQTLNDQALNNFSFFHLERQNVAMCRSKYIKYLKRGRKENHSFYLLFVLICVEMSE